MITIEDVKEALREAIFQGEEPSDEYSIYDEGLRIYVDTLASLHLINLRKGMVE